MVGDVFAVSILLIATYITVLIINKLTGLLIFLLKKIFLLTIVTLAFYQFLMSLVLRVGQEGLTQDLAILGAAGTLAGFTGIIIALYAAFYSFKRLRLTIEGEPTETAGDNKGHQVGRQVSTQPEQVKKDKDASIFSISTL